MLLVSLLFIQCFTVHFVWDLPNTMPVFRNECNITDRSFPGVWTGGGPSTAALFLFLGRMVGWRGVPHSTLLPKSNGFKTQAAGQPPGKAEMGRMLALRPDTRDYRKLICMSYHSLRSPNNLCYLRTSNRIVFCICTLPGRDVFWSRKAPKSGNKQTSFSFLPGHLSALPAIPCMFGSYTLL